ncbi:MAG: cytochrome c-type biosis protein CcmE [Thermoleophilaceae bacterium]|jgi:cytochrome c-type biogenesis protein CcmE|nr:cytochrome c-type biosis protein CcmE [Thermoleophilaceae bacterium]
MDPSRKRKVRLVVALAAALLLAGTLLYTSFASSTEAKTPSQVLASGASGGTYEMTGKVVPGSIQRPDDGSLVFQVRDREGTKAIPVTYTGTVPDPFRDGREVIVTGKLENGTFVGERNSLVTKCPSKFKNDKSGSST